MTADAHAAPRVALRPPRLLALADDLTGADALAAALCARGYRAAVTLRLPTAFAADALVVDIATRNASPARAAARISSVMSGTLALPPQMLALRIDSTLRGNVLVTLAAMLRALPPETLAVVTPAVPGAGRTLVAGRLHAPSGVGGAGYDLLAAARGMFGRAVIHVSLDDLHRGLDAVAARLLPASVRVVVADIAAQTDFALLAAASVRSGRPLLPVDAGPLTVAVALRLIPPPRRVVALLGTAAAASVAQRALAAERFGVPAHDSGTAAGLMELAACDDEVCLAFIGEGAVRRAARAGMADATDILCKGVGPRGLVLSGGATARQVLRRLGARGVVLEREVEPLVAYGRLAGGPWHGLPVITKGGMVGDRASLWRCLNLLRGVPEDHG